MTLQQQDRRWLVVVLVAAIAVAVLLPVVALVRQLGHHTPVAYAFDEDAFFTFTIARNIATGHGITIDGQHITSGTQALWTLLLVVPFLLHAGARATLALIGTMSLALWLTAAWSFSAILIRWVPTGPLRRVEARLLFALVYVACQNVRTLSWGGLETGLYLALLLFVAQRFVFDSTRRGDLECGLWMAALALARVDAVVLVVGLAAGRAYLHRRSEWRRALLVPLGVAIVALVPQALWDLHVAGNVLPQSGIAESAAVYWFGVHQNIRAAETFAPYLVLWPFVPTALHHLRAVGLGVLLVEGALLWRARLSVDRATKEVLVGLAALAGAICVAYVVRSPVFLFYIRYFMPFGLFLLGLTALALWRVVSFAVSHASLAAALVPAVVAAAILGHEPRHVAPAHMGNEVISFAAHAELAVCGQIGMFESGRMGFAYQGRIVNLDGKVNVAALKADVHHRLLAYLAEEHISVLYVHKESLGFMDLITPGWRASWTVRPDPGQPEADFIVSPLNRCL